MSSTMEAVKDKLSSAKETVKEKIGEAGIGAKESYNIGKAKGEASAEQAKLQTELADDKLAHKIDRSRYTDPTSTTPSLTEKAMAGWDTAKETVKEKLGEASISAKENKNIGLAKAEAAADTAKLKAQTADNRLADKM